MKGMPPASNLFPCQCGNVAQDFARDKMRAKQKVISDINFLGVIGIIRTDKPEQVMPVCEALIAGGINILELTMTIPDAVNTLKEVSQRFSQQAIVGMGTVLDIKSAKAAVDAGAEFLVTPVTRLEVLQVAKASGRVCMLGAYTPTEALLAHDAGADYVKIFPADNLGPGYIKALRNPMPQLRLVPTGGVTLENIAEWFRAGAPAVGVGSSLVSKRILAEENWVELLQIAGEFAAAARAAKAG
jgi:2-dehydro-3-deoxyphosphogluconate aldolase/(4S)-4-hydroxy-2-oxoglutarate aldolase